MRAVFSAALASVAICASGACSFPDVTIASGSADGGRDGATPPVDGGEDANMMEDAPVDSGAYDAPQFDSGDPCDRDGDGYRAKGGVCGGLDCDDNDPHANPGITMFQTYPPHPPTNGDWNCDGTVDYQYPTNFNCPGLLSACSMTGFRDMPGCGAIGDFITCKSNGVTCVIDQHESGVYEGCK